MQYDLLTLIDWLTLMLIHDICKNIQEGMYDIQNGSRT